MRKNNALQRHRNVKRRNEMKGRILDPQVKVYSDPSPNALSLATLPAGSEIEFGAPRRKAGKVWVPITLTTGQQAFISGETRVSVIQQATLLQKDVEMHSEPSADSPVKQRLAGNPKVYILEAVGQGNQGWFKVRDASGSEGFIPRRTRMRVIVEKTKALGKKNMLTGALWLIGGVVVTAATWSAASGGGTYIFAWGAILFGAVQLIIGLVQFLTAPT